MSTSLMQIESGAYIPPIKRIEIFDDVEWEEFTKEWLEIRMKSKGYFDIDKIGGAGDMGRDVIAYITNPKNDLNYKWDCYQCKHYNEPLSPSKIYVELGKIIYFSFLKKFPAPKGYYFVSPKGVGASLHNLLKNPINLKDSLIKNWDKYCKNKITNTEIALEGDFKIYLDNFNFSIFDKVKTSTIINEHSSHRNHKKLFGGGMKVREPFDTDKDIPGDIQGKERTYVEKLVDAYSDDSSCTYDDIESLDGKYKEHFTSARLAFYHAEQLKRLYRDALPVGTYEDFEQQVLAGIDGLNYESFNTQFRKVVKVENESTRVIITDNPLINVSKTYDKIGICHHLANSNKLNWKND